MNTQQNFSRWLESPKVSPAMKDEMRKMSPQEVDESFFKNIEFGTAGMRGIIGPGTNRMNFFTIQRAAVGFALYLFETFPKAKELGVVVSHDNRRMSREFTMQITDIFSKMGLKSYIFDALRPTPELSFAVRYKKACGGIMITASHNPKEYNGFKVYDQHGCQLVPAKIAKLIAIIDRLPDELALEIPPSLNRGEIIVLDSDVDEEYIRLVKEIQLNPALPKEVSRLSIPPTMAQVMSMPCAFLKTAVMKFIPSFRKLTPIPISKVRFRRIPKRKRLISNRLNSPKKSAPTLSS